MFLLRMLFFSIFISTEGFPFAPALLFFYPLCMGYGILDAAPSLTHEILSDTCVTLECLSGMIMYKYSKVDAVRTSAQDIPSATARSGIFQKSLVSCLGEKEVTMVMSPMHANPYDAVRIFVDTKCKKALGIHWGTFVLTDEPVLEPPRLLKEALGKEGIEKEGVFDVLNIGETREY